MKLHVILLIMMSLIVNLASAQDYARQARSLKEAADVASRKSFTKGNAYAGYLNSFRLYQKAGDKYKKERIELLSTTSALLVDERYLMKRDALVVDSLLDEAYGEFKDDIKNYLPLLESYVCKASGTEDKYAHSFALFDRAMEIRKSNNLQKGSGYETLLRWYCSHFFYRKEISQNDKVNIYRELWEVYLSNKSDSTELDIKLLDSFRSTCGFNGHEDIKVMLSELKSTYIVSHFGKDSDEYLKIQETLAMDYRSLVAIEEKKGIKSESAKKELTARLEVWRVKKMKDEIYDSDAASTFGRLLYSMLNTSKDTIAARSLANEYKKTISNKLGTNCEVYVTVLDNLCHTYGMSDAEKIPVLKEKLAIEKKLYGKDDYRTQATSSSLSMIYSDNHQLGESIATTMSNMKNDDYLSLLTLASTQTRYGQHRKANETYEKLLNMCQENPSLKPMIGFSSIMGSINNYNKLNDIKGLLEFGSKWSNTPSMSYGEQELVFKNVMGIASLPGKSNIQVVEFADEFLVNHLQQMSNINSLIKVLEYKASALYGMTQFDNAITVINQIIAQISNNSIENKIDLLKYSVELEICYIAKQDFNQALLVNKRNMDILRTIPGYETSMEYCSTCARACLCYDQLGDYSQILHLAGIVRSLENVQKHTLDPIAAFEVNNFMALSYMLDTSSIITPLVHAYCNDKKYQDASSFIVDYIKNLESTIKFTLTQLDTNNALGRYSYIKTSADNLNLVASFQPDNQSLIETVFDFCLLTKQAFLASEAQMRKQILESGDSILIAKFTNIQTLRNSIQTYEKSGLDASNLQEQLHQLETQILEDSQAYGDFTKALDLHWKDIQSALVSASAMVEFVSYPNFVDKKNYLAAVVLKKEWDVPQMVLLCCEDELQKDNIMDGNNLYTLVWKPILDKLKQTNNIYFSPAGIIYNLSIENARYGNGFVSDSYNLYRISSARQLFSNTTSIGSGAVLCGGIVYSLTAEELSESNNASVEGNTTRYTTRGAISDIPYLSGTKVEVESIQHTLQNNNAITTIVFKGKDAVENVIRNINPQSVKIVHVATHGFYDSEDTLLSNPIINVFQSDMEDRMLSRNGLYMAGAQNTLDGDIIPEGVDDGILTAQEISTLDLRGLDLVTLSACETGLGEVSGEGVFGLQRGFKKAGVQSILMSLWKVDDEATCKLMTEFYGNWIAKKMTKHDALEAAKKVVRETKGWENPKYWAAFILLDGLD